MAAFLQVHVINERFAMSGTLHKNSMTLRLSVKFFFRITHKHNQCKNRFHHEIEKIKHNIKNQVKGFWMQISEWNSIRDPNNNKKKII